MTQDWSDRVTLNHYFPGAVLPVDSIPDEGYSFSFNNRNLKDLPPAPPQYQQFPGQQYYPGGWDIGRPGMPDNPQFPFGDGAGVSDLLWTVTSPTDKWVDIYVLFMGQGGGIVLWEPTPPGSTYQWIEHPMPDNGYALGGGGRARGGSVPYGNYKSSGSVRVFLAAGVTYILQVSSSFSQAESDAAAALGYVHGVGGYDQDYYMEVHNTPLKTNDLKTNAFDVVIPADGGTYHADPVLNTCFTNSAEDPPLFYGTYASAWWKYVPTSNTDITVSWAIIPQGQTKFQCIAWQENSDGSLTFLAGQGGNISFTVPSVPANTVIYFQISGNDQWNDHQSYAQWYQLSVTGAKSVAQAPNVTHLGPPNDLRENAIVVAVDDDNAYLSDDVTLTYANPGAVGTEGPYNQDPEAMPLYQTAWWKYTPTEDGSAAFRAHSNPANDPNARIMILNESLVSLGVTGMGQNLVFNVGAGHTYWIVLGTSDPATSLSASFGMTGPISAAGGTPPVNDLRLHATRVFIDKDGDTYLTIDTDLSYATPAASGYTTSPYVPDQEASPLYQTAWWIYKPQTTGTATIRAHSNPASNPAVQLMVFHFVNNGLTQLATVGMSMDYTHTVVDGDTYYYVLGTTAQQTTTASFGMTGPRTTPDKKPDPKKPVKPKPAQCGTVMDLIREYQAASGHAVRIIDSTTIEVFDAYALGVPDAFDGVDPEDCYSSAEIDLASSANVLVLEKGLIDLTAHADITDNDIGIVTSGWRLLDHLPFPGLDDAPVNKVSMTFTPDTFQCNIDFTFPDVPLSYRTTEDQ